MTKRIAILDLGGQYCHMISRRLGDLGIGSDVLAPATPASRLDEYAGIILSGGPKSVYDADAPAVDRKLFSLGKPVLGICYGHQLLAQAIGGEVKPGKKEYGPSELHVTDTANPLFVGTPPRQKVWMSHGDSVVSLPNPVVRIAETPRCEAAAFADVQRRFYAVQFHPEVAHTEFGTTLLRNFGVDICGVAETVIDDAQIERLLGEIRRKVGDQSVFFLVSGGVDSMVAFTLCAKALGEDRVLGLYVNTGLMRLGETEELQKNLQSLGLEARVKIRDESERFLSALANEIEPERKRQIIGRLFVKVQEEAMRELGINENEWFLGQGTIYPDTIESGGATGRAAVIKTHHNRCAEIQHLIERGRVVEPLTDFYKDQVRRIGTKLGLSRPLVNRWPFPGPGLAIRCLCTAGDNAAHAKPLETSVDVSGFTAMEMPLYSVGVQGDFRTYSQIVALKGALDYDRLQQISSGVCNGVSRFNRVVVQVGKARGALADAQIHKTTLTPDRVRLLQEADRIVRSTLERDGLAEEVWQFPVVLIPVSFAGGESIVLRPVNSQDGMTANFARMKPSVIEGLAAQIMELKGIDAVFLDVTDKPPATIEWE
ncbi:MAG TPA: glutamine-hydrolyzing GMP synthase [Gemmatimonadaceae bacterium]|nr:glutamine-hydrolyzing GMP synthase [Gemmatimonadaceae bacterium]